jgi:hypothetical protein
MSEQTEMEPPDDTCRWWHRIPVLWLLLDREWWRYIFRERHRDSGFFRTALCRWRGHPAGVWWFNPGAYEPDMHCKNCGDDLG